MCYLDDSWLDERQLSSVAETKSTVSAALVRKRYVDGACLVSPGRAISDMWSASIHSIHVDSWHISLPSSLADLGTSTKHWLIRSLHVPKSRQQPMMQRCWSRWSKRPCSLRETKWNEVMDTPSERSLAAMPRIVCGFNSFACRRHNLVLHGSAPFTVAHPGTLHRTSLESALNQPWVSWDSWESWQCGNSICIPCLPFPMRRSVPPTDCCVRMGQTRQDLEMSETLGKMRDICGVSGCIWCEIVIL